MKIGNENGTQNAVDAFYRHLPLKNMLCDVSICIGEAKLAQVWDEKLFIYLI